MTQEEIASETGLHPSTISRTVNGKYLQFEAKVFSLKSFFPSRISSGSSSEEVKTVIRSIISGESKTRPVSDGKIARYLASSGHPLTKRTVTKYRQSMGIPPYNQRYSYTE